MAGGGDSDGIAVELGRQQLQAAGFTDVGVQWSQRGEFWNTPPDRVTRMAFISYLGRDQTQFSLESLRRALELPKA